MILTRAVVVGLSVLGALLVVVPPSSVGAEPTTLLLSTASGYADEAVPLTVVLTRTDGSPLAGAQVQVERLVEGAWTAVGEVLTDAAGTGSTTAVRAREAVDNSFRATFLGDDVHAPSVSEAVTSRLVRRAGVVTVDGPDEVVDERVAVLRITWAASTGDAVTGAVRLQRADAGGGWRAAGTAATDRWGHARVKVRPRVDTRWRVLAPALDWVRADTSPAFALDNLPPGAPVRLPPGAPQPRVPLPRARRAPGPGAQAVVSRIPDDVWHSMVGRTWHRGCPVGRSGLRLLRINYWGYDGYRYRGELVAATNAVDTMAKVLSVMYRERYPIRSMYRVDRFGWSERLQGGDDYRSMAAGNTSAFNCRWVVNRPGVRSPHSYGRALDLNTWENPYRSATGLVPNSWWQPRSHPLVAWRSRSHPVVRLFLRQGFSWTYGSGDSQHFDVRR